MIVLDASAMVELLVGSDTDDDLLQVVFEDIHVPHLIDVEVLSVLRRLVRTGQLSAGLAQQAIEDFYAITMTRHTTIPFAGRIWALRGHLTAYDAAYVALADTLAAPLYTCDAKLVGAAPGVEARVFPLSGRRKVGP